MSRLLVSVAFVAVLTAASTAFAWQPIASGSPTWSGRVPYFLNNAGSPDLGGFSGSETQVRQGMDDWTRVSCTSLTNNYGGGTSRQPGNYEGTSTIGWVESGWRHGSSAIGVTGPSWRGSTIVEADMELNGVNYTWITGPGSRSNVNAYSIILHEGGHYYGLGHSDQSSATMYFAYTGGIDSLGTDDSNGICTLYPGSGSTDCTTTGCPSGQECVSGSCQAVTGDGSLCSPCADSSECGGANDFCLMYPTGGAYCGVACTGAADCGTGYQCVSVGGTGQCVGVVGGSPSCSGTTSTGCRSDSECSATQRCNTSTGACEARPTGGAELGQPCESNEACNSGLCATTAAGSVCSQSCDGFNTASCPSGFYCDGLATGACGAGVCLAGSPGAGAVGDPCNDNTDCSNFYCFLGLCSEPCNPETVGACPGGGVCQVGALACRGACGAAGSLGDPCDANSECASEMCATTGEDRFCTQLCDASSPCPEGYGCTSAGAVNVCVPNGGALGGECAANEDCATGICAFEEDRAYCTRLCDASSPCPEYMQCVDSGTPGLQVCQPRPGQDPRGGQSGRRMVSGCHAAPGPAGAPLGLLLFGCLLAGLRRRAHLSPRR
ncbi:MAG: matrixin family metalloprotease [Myxococcales bacterium]|nr:matrixin family metalloprotease [Myxococcales bacterium]